MSSGTAKENPSPALPDQDPELAPSRVSEEEFSLPRLIGLVGMFLALLGSTLLFLSVIRDREPQLWHLGPLLGGLVMMLYHAGRDRDTQVVRAYGLFAAALLVMGAIFAVLPGGPEDARVMGYNFLPYGFGSLLFGLFFLIPYVRREPDEDYRRYAVLLMLGLGVAFSDVIVAVGIINPSFMIGPGALMCLLGLAFSCVHVAQVGAATGIGHKVAVGIGVTGVVMILYAVIRSIAADDAPYLVPTGLIFIGLGVLYGLFSIGLLSDLQVVLITRRELAAFFYSPIAYIVLLGMSLLGWFNYILFLDRLYSLSERDGIVMEPILQGYIFALFAVLAPLVAVPAVTMRLFSEERRTGTLEVLMTAPVTEWSVVLGKFFAALAFYLVIWVPWLLYPITLGAETGVSFDYLPLLTFLLPLTVTGASFVAMGLFLSCITRNQIIAAVLTFVGMCSYLAFFILGSVEGVGEVWRNLFDRLTFLTVWNQALTGQLMIRDLVLHLSVALFWLFATVKVLEARRWS